MKPVFMIFAKHEVENGTWHSYSDRRFTTREAAEHYIKYVIEPYDKECGVYEPDYFEVVDMTEYFN